MRKVFLSMKEMLYYTSIKDFVDHGGNKHRLAMKLNLSVRQVNRLILKYKEKGKAGFVHGNKNRQPINSLPQELNKRIVNLYMHKYQGFNFVHFVEKLHDEENITVSYSTVYHLLTSNNIFPPYEHKITKKNRAKKQILKANPDISAEDIETAICHEIDLEDAHPRKQRCKYFGEQIQMDASIHKWFGEEKTALHLAIDNATGQIIGAYFDTQETLHGYYTIFKQILMQYGIPVNFLTDNRTVFNYERVNRKTDDKDVLTQFGYACKVLGVSIETSSVSQYKGQIERCNGTLQRRLVNELRLQGITDINEANEYTLKVFIPSFNKHFALPIDKFVSVMEKAPSEKKINEILSILSPRTFDAGSSIKYKNKYYQAYNSDNELICFSKGTKCLVIKSFDNQLYVTVGEVVYALKELESHHKISEQFDTCAEAPKQKKKYIPPMSHPWKRDSFIKQQERAHKAHIYA